MPLLVDGPQTMRRTQMLLFTSTDLRLFANAGFAAQVDKDPAEHTSKVLGTGDLDRLTGGQWARC